MNTHADRPLARSHSNSTPLGRFAVWVAAKLRARRARRLEEETVACLSAMDTRLLNDIGVDIGKLSELPDECRHVSDLNPLPPSQYSDQFKRS
jgi:uncharacterized protein YjiS (DUF1127 family)